MIYLWISNTYCVCEAMGDEFTNADVKYYYKTIIKQEEMDFENQDK